MGFSCLLSGLPTRHSAFGPIFTSLGGCVTDSFSSFCDVNLVAALLSSALSGLLNWLPLAFQLSSFQHVVAIVSFSILFAV